MTITKIRHSGAYQISAVIGGHLVTRTYYGYTKRESVQEFNKETRKCHTKK